MKQNNNTMIILYKSLLPTHFIEKQLISNSQSVSSKLKQLFNFLTFFTFIGTKIKMQ